MSQCKAITAVGTQCLRNAHPMCDGYCSQHFNKSSPYIKGKITARSKAAKYLINCGKVVGAFTGAYEITEKIIQIAGPFLSLVEIHKLEIIKQSRTKAEFVSSSKSLVNSLTRPRFVLKNSPTIGTMRSSKLTSK